MKRIAFEDAVHNEAEPIRVQARFNKPETFLRHLDRVCVTKLVGREPTAHARLRRGARELLARRRGLPVTTGGRGADHTQQRADWQTATHSHPGLQLRPRPPIQPDLATTATFASAYQDRASVTLERA